MSMKPGRELDALIAEKVMGLAVLNGQIFRYDKSYEKGDIATAVGCPIPSYSTDMAAAWEVVEKLEGINIFKDYPEKNEWHVSFLMCDDFGCDDLCTSSNSAPHAICLAALKAVGT